MNCIRWFCVALVLSMLCWAVGASQAADPPKKVLLIGQKRDHPPGAHQYMAGLRVLSHCLKQVPGLEVTIVQADEPWPDGPQLLTDIDGVVLSLGQGARWIQSDPQRLKAIEQLARKRTGIVAIHWAIGAQDGKYIAPHREIIGGVHGGDDRKYFFGQSELAVLEAGHPIMLGVSGMPLEDEWYYQLKFSPEGRVVPLMCALIGGQRETVAWAYTRAHGGRSFGFSGMHYHENWKNASLRRMIAQAVLWTMELPVPEQGLKFDVPSEVFQLEPGE